MQFNIYRWSCRFCLWYLSLTAAGFYMSLPAFSLSFDFNLIPHAPVFVFVLTTPVDTCTPRSQHCICRLSRARFQTREVAFFDSWSKAVLTAWPVRACGWRPEQDPSDELRREIMWKAEGWGSRQMVERRWETSGSKGQSVTWSGCWGWSSSSHDPRVLQRERLWTKHTHSNPLPFITLWFSQVSPEKLSCAS